MPQTALHSINLKTYGLAAIAAQLPPSTADPELQYLFQQLANVTAQDPNWPEGLRTYVRHPHDGDRALLGLSHQLALTPLELLAVSLALAVETETWVGRALAKVQTPLGGSRPTLGLLATTLGQAVNQPAPMPTLANGNAVQSGLLTRLHPDAPLPEQAVRIPAHLSFALQGYDSPYPGTTLELGAVAAVKLPPSILATAQRQARGLQESSRRALVLRTGSMPEGRSVAMAIAAALNRRPLFIETDVIPGLGPWLRLRQLLPVFCLDLGPGERQSLPLIPFYDGPQLVLCGLDGGIELAGQAALSWTIPVPSRSERLALWQAIVQDAELATQLARHHRHSSGRIAQLGALAQHHSQLRDRPHPTAADIAAVAWHGEGIGLDALAQPLPTQISDQALVMPSALRQDLQTLRLRCQNRDGLVADLGVSAQARYYPGVRTLFVGPSGTGKTLAASWLATQLGMPLYRVDLAAVSSKYIGETEKNLAQLLARAEQAEVILLFDEADSLFGKRTDIQQSTDRFANAQTNYLLQRIESFDGIAILTSNSRNRFDAAFTRRLDIVIEFEAPGPPQRKALWQSHLGDQHQLTVKELNQLAASAHFNGGNIRNVVLAAAVLAQEDNRAITYADLIQSLEEEYRKLGQPVPGVLKRQA